MAVDDEAVGGTSSGADRGEGTGAGGGGGGTGEAAAGMVMADDEQMPSEFKELFGLINEVKAGPTGPN